MVLTKLDIDLFDSATNEGYWEISYFTLALAPYVL